MTEHPKLVNTETAAELIGIPRKSVTRLIREGQLAAIKLGRYWVVPVGEIDRLVEQATAERRSA